MDATPVIGLCTVPDADVAARIANDLVAEQLAACVNIIPGITSVYRWQGKVTRDDEQLLMIKTTTGAWTAIEQRIAALHPYELPEIIAVPIQTGQADYLKWLTDSIQ